MIIIAHGRIAEGAGPDWGDQRADGETVACDQICDFADVCIACVGVGMGEEQEVVDPFEFLTVDIGCGRQFEHPF